MAAKHYDNIFYDDEEFQEDLQVIGRIARLFRKYEKHGDLNIQSIINNIIIVYNMWPSLAEEMLFLKLKEYKILLKTFLFYMDKKPKPEFIIGVNNEIIKFYEIPIDEDILNKLKSDE